MNNLQGLAIIDAQRCFMPRAEGERLGVEGFGELPVPDGHKVVDPINALTHVFRHYMQAIVTTADQHPNETAHFADEPNFVNTWPKHGRANTPGGMLHPELFAARYKTIARHFIKGDTAAATPDDDTSYTGALAHNPETGQLLPEYLRERGVTAVTIAGLALGDGQANKLCVDSTAIDLHEQGFEVTVATDATEAVLPENRKLCFQNLGKRGIKLATTAEIINQITELYNK